MHGGRCPKTFCGGLGRQIALRHRQQLIANHELADGGRSEQRRIEVGVQVPGLAGIVIGRLLVKTHRIREWSFEEIVVARRDLFQSVGELRARLVVLLIDGGDVTLADEEGFKRPHRPERHHNGESAVFIDASRAGSFQGNIIT